MTLIQDQTFEGERALYQSDGVRIERCVFNDGESPLKESRGIEVADSVFRWRYPLWYCADVTVEGSLWLDTCRAPIWYTDGLTIANGSFQAPKGIRRCQNVVIRDTNFPNAQETLWNCSDVTASHISVNGDYFAKDCENVHIDGLDLTGKYPFDGCRHVGVENARMVTRDAFWKSLQGLCYIEGLTLVDCRLVNTTLAFERCHGIDAEVMGSVDSIANPGSGTIRVGGVGELIQDDPQIDASRVEIVVVGDAACGKADGKAGDAQRLALVG